MPPVIKAASTNTIAAAITGSFLSVFFAFGIAVFAEADVVERLFPTHTIALLVFALIIPFTYQAGGSLLYSDMGWSFFQPGYGGARFIALNGLAWTFYPVMILGMLLSAWSENEQIIHDAKVVGGAFGLLSYFFMFSSLLVYHPVRYQSLSEEDALDELKLDQASVAFNRELLKSALMRNGENVSGFWWMFVGMQLSLSVAGLFVSYIGDTRLHSTVPKSLASMVSMWMIATSVSVTHSFGGRWKHVTFRGIQPCKGGAAFIFIQFFGWLSLGISGAACITPILCHLMDHMHIKKNEDLEITCDISDSMPLVFQGLLGVFAEFMIVLSLFAFQRSDEAIADAKGNEIEENNCTPPLSETLIDIQFAFLNFIFGKSNAQTTTRTPTVKTVDDYKDCEKKWNKVTAHCKKTGYQYLIIGVGFLGKRLVNRLLQRGETKIRLFDLSPVNPFEGDSRIEYVRGDVTNLQQIQQACQGVDVIYCTFAIIRFMDRLDHQAALSYRINVIGTEQVLKAAVTENVRYMIVTSSAHATTDEHSEPKLNRDESAPYVTRETAHNHYGWTKAIADQLCLKANGTITPNGNLFKVSICRPGGIFGGDDRFSFEKAINMGIYPVLGARSVIDWVHVENVVLGHILCEAALLENRENVAGEAFNISNGEAYSNEDFWWTVKKIHTQLQKAGRTKTSFRVVYIPEFPLWIIAYISEFNQWLFRGRVSLGADIDMLTPPALSTAIMPFSYKIDKAKKYLGYDPVYTVDESIQKSFMEYYESKYPAETKKKQ